MITLEGVAKEYPTVQGQPARALRNVNLCIGQGEFIGIAGRNASGKTTLARLLNGLLLPTQGHVKVAGMDTRDRKHRMEIRRRVAMVFQNPENQIVNPIVEEEIAFGPENLNLSRKEIKRRVDQAIHLMHLDEFRRHAPHLLSGGQKQRVGIAAALAMEPDVLVLDEPTSMLDAYCRKELMDHLIKLNREQGMTMVLVSHNMEDLAEADRLVVLEEGSILADAPPWQVFQEQNLPGMLRVPDIVQLVQYLNQWGENIPPQIRSRKALVNYLCQ